MAIAFLLEGVQLAAQIIGLQAGYSYASTVDPSTQADTTTLQLLAQLLAGSLFFAFGLDRQVIRVLAGSLQSMPTGSFALTRIGCADAIARLGAAIFNNRPATGAAGAGSDLVLLDVAFAVLGRLHAQLQLLSLSFAIKMLVGLAFLASNPRLYPGVFERSAAATFELPRKVVPSTKWPDQGQRTEKPTKRKLEKAAREGQFPASRELLAALQFLAFVALVGAGAPTFSHASRQMTRYFLAGAFSWN